MLDPDVRRRLEDVSSLVADINTAINSMVRADGQLRNASHPVSLQEFQRMDADLLSLYAKSIKSLADLLSTVERIAGPPSMQPPTADEARAKLLAFLSENPPVRQSPLPPKLRGKSGARPGCFICARFRAAFCLMVVIALEGEICTAYDASDTARIAKLESRKWVPLTTALPEKPTPRLEFTRGALVLAMWNRTDRKGDWTTEFFAATVVSRPCDRTGEDTRGYLLDFRDLSDVEGRKRIIVPEQFVVADAEGWLK
jgi:hypothetical protein